MVKQPEDYLMYVGRRAKMRIKKTHNILFGTQTVMDLNFYRLWNKISREDYGIILCVHKILNMCINSHLYGIFVSAANAAILNTAVKTIVVSY